MTANHPDVDPTGRVVLETLSDHELRERLRAKELEPTAMKSLALRIFGEHASFGEERLGREILLDGREVKIAMRDAERARVKNPAADLTRFSTDCAQTPARADSVVLYVPTEGARPVLDKEGGSDFLNGVTSSYLKLQAMVLDQAREREGGERTRFGAVLRSGKSDTPEAVQLKTEATTLLKTTAAYLVEGMIGFARNGKLEVEDEIAVQVAELIGCDGDDAKGIALDVLARTRDVVREIALQEPGKQGDESEVR